MNTYVCKFDNVAFSSEEDLIDHIKNNYMTVVKEGENANEIQKIYLAFNENFPGAKVDVRTDTEDGGYLVSLLFDFAEFTFQVGEGDWNYYYGRFIKVEDAVKYYNEFFTKADEIKNKVKIEYRLDLEITHMREAGADHDDFSSITFKFKINDTIYINTYEFKPDYDITDFVKSFKQYFYLAVEGELKKKTDDGYFVDYEIGGVPLSGMIQRGKKFRFEIIG